MMPGSFRNRQEAGRALAQALEAYRDRGDVVVLALPRGGVPVGYEVARALGAELDLMLVRKLGFPGQEELAMGAIATGGVQVLNEEVVRQASIPPQVIERVAQQERRELERRQQAYRGDRPLPQIAGRCVILVDDGLATGSTMRAAVRALRQQGPGRVVVAVPVAPPETCQVLRQEVDEVVCLMTPRAFGGVGRWYEDFSQISDEEVRWLLQRAWQPRDEEEAGAA